MKKSLFLYFNAVGTLRQCSPKSTSCRATILAKKFKVEIHKDDGLLGVEFTLDKTITEFSRASEKLNLDYVTSFAEFGNLLLGRYQTDWKQVLHEHFPEPVDTEVVRPAQDCNLAENFSRAIDLFLTCTLNKKNQGSPVHILGTGWRPWRP
jgi:hypothetical protein